MIERTASNGFVARPPCPPLGCPSRDTRFPDPPWVFPPGEMFLDSGGLEYALVNRDAGPQFPSSIPRCSPTP